MPQMKPYSWFKFLVFTNILNLIFFTNNFFMENKTIFKISTLKINYLHKWYW